MDVLDVLKVKDVWFFVFFELFFVIFDDWCEVCVWNVIIEFVEWFTRIGVVLENCDVYF